MTLAGCVLALSWGGCNSNGSDSKNDGTAMSPIGNQPMAPAGAMGAPPGGAAPTGSASPGSMAGPPAGAAGSSPMVNPGAAGAAPGSAGNGSDVTTGNSSAGSDANAAGSTGESPDGGAAEAADAAMPPPPPHEDLGKGDGRDVVLMGDSYMSNTLQIEGTGGGIAPSLQRASGQPYPNYGVQGVMLLSADAFGPAIPTQWDQAKAFGAKIQTVVMTGGGNDVIQNPGLQSDCMMDGPQCMQFRMDLVAALDKLWTQMAMDGVQDIIYVRYASNGMMMTMSGSAASLIPSICTTGKVRCHSLDTTDLVNGEIAGDGIHPLVTANDRIAKALVDMMESEGMRR
jgi:hypothetical protein